MDTSSDKIVHFVQVQVGENDQVKTSNAMEKFGCVKGLGELRENGVEVASLTTDRHAAIKKHMRTKEPDVLHKFDVWHVAKGIKKKLVAVSKRAECAELQEWVQPVVNHLYWCVAVSKGDGLLLVAMWRSMLNHVVNVHSGHGDAYPRCVHDGIPDGKWLLPGTPSYARLLTIATERTLLKDMEQLSSLGQTYGLESYLSLLIKFAPKSVAFTPEAMRARTELAALHQNENAGRPQAVTKEGEPRYKRKMLRTSNRREVACLVKTKPTYGYVKVLMAEMLHVCSECPSFKEANTRKDRSHIPLPMSQQLPNRRETKVLAAERCSRFRTNPATSL
ncbi:uncharacterized protein LOC144165999 isoform X2 [Haemaphysalis longicornis]